MTAPTRRVSAYRVAVIRAAADLAPKVVAAGIGGLSATTLITLASTVGVVLSPGLASLVTAIIAAVCGYIKADTPLLHDLEVAAEQVADQPASPVTVDGVGEIAKILGIGGRAEDD